MPMDGILRGVVAPWLHTASSRSSESASSSLESFFTRQVDKSPSWRFRRTMGWTGTGRRPTGTPKPASASTSRANRDQRMPYCLPFSILEMTVWSMPDCASRKRCVHPSARRRRLSAAPIRSKPCCSCRSRGRPNHAMARGYPPELTSWISADHSQAGNLGQRYAVHWHKRKWMSPRRPEIKHQTVGKARGARRGGWWPARWAGRTGRVQTVGRAGIRRAGSPDRPAAH